MVSRKTLPDPADIPNRMPANIWQNWEHCQCLLAASVLFGFERILLQYSACRRIVRQIADEATDARRRRVFPVATEIAIAIVDIWRLNASRQRHSCRHASRRNSFPYAGVIPSHCCIVHIHCTIVSKEVVKRRRDVAKSVADANTTLGTDAATRTGLWRSGFRVTRNGWDSCHIYHSFALVPVGAVVSWMVRRAVVCNTTVCTDDSKTSNTT